MEHEVGNPEFDSLLGGSQKLPSGINLSEFIKHRMEEVVMLTESIKESPFRGQTFQRLPKHMRRRQMSHYIKRLPRRLQRSYLSSLKEGMPPPTKCPSRKYRRRPGNLLLEYNRRQKKSIWLETHIWHAKRFHMTEKWGYKLPERPVDKSFRACYRAISEHCLLTDISYYNCIELKGSEVELLKGLQQCNSQNCGLTFGAKMYLDGSREGLVTLFHPNSYPYKVIGNVTFLWEPVTNTSESRTIWIWVHPLLHEEAVKCFKDLFNLNIVEEKSNIVKESAIVVSENMNGAKKLKQVKRQRKQNQESKKRIEQIKLEPKNIPFIRMPKYTNKNESITMTLLKDTLNRFQLTGPLSQAIISQLFTVAVVTSQREKSPDIEFVKVESTKKRKIDVEIISEVKKIKLSDACDEVPAERRWWEEYYKKDAHWKIWKEQKDFYSKLSECCKPTDVPPGLVLSLVVGDPRLKIPPKREKAVPEMKESKQILESTLNPNLSKSPIWDPRIRDEVSITKLTTQEINKARSKKIVPGFDKEVEISEEKQSRIPILLVQRPGRRETQFGKLGLGSGWDIISPAGFGMPIWLALIFRGARTGGLRESELLQLECNNLNGYLQPDSAAGELENRSTTETLRQRYFRLPPNKRPNYIKLGVTSPFHCPWQVLVRDWMSGNKNSEIQTQGFSVMRDRKTLRELNEVVAGVTKREAFNLDKCLCAGTDCLVPVVIEYSGKGKPQDFALICLPENEDLKNLSEGKASPVEPSHVDENEKLRKSLKLEHSKVLKSLKRKRKKERAKLKEEFANNSAGKLKWKEIAESNSSPSETSSEEFKLKMESLWVPESEKIDTLRDSCSRRILGFVAKGDYSFSKSVGLALGYVTLPGLVEVAKDSCRMKEDLPTSALLPNGDSEPSPTTPKHLAVWGM